MSAFSLCGRRFSAVLLGVGLVVLSSASPAFAIAARYPLVKHIRTTEHVSGWALAAVLVAAALAGYYLISYVRAHRPPLAARGAGPAWRARPSDQPGA